MKILRTPVIALHLGAKQIDSQDTFDIYKLPGFGASRCVDEYSILMVYNSSKVLLLPLFW